MMKKITHTLASESETKQLGKALAPLISAPLLCCFRGDIGAGKTTLIRALLRALGVRGAIKSPTFSIVEEYDLAHFHAYHFDLYRINQEEELDYIGFRDYFKDSAVCFIEWPELAGAQCPVADLWFDFSVTASGRELSLSANTSAGEVILAQLTRGERLLSD